MRMRSALLVSLVIAGLAATPLVSAAQCTSQNNCHFWDDRYHEDVFFDWDTTQIDVLVTPPVTPFALTDLAAVEQSIQAWEDGIQYFGATWLKQNLAIDSYTLGKDIPPASALADPEIIVALSAEFNPVVLFGVAVLAPLQWCHGLGLSADAPMPELWTDLPLDWHQHADSAWASARVECQSGGVQCYVVNTNFLLGGVNRLYDLNAHEFGHCLGAGHVGDANVAPGEFNAKTIPTEDIMSYKYTPSQVHCVSTLNVRTIEGVFAEVAGRPSSEWLGAGEFVHMDQGAYQQTDCDNPSNDLFAGLSTAGPTQAPIWDFAPLAPVEPAVGDLLTAPLADVTAVDPEPTEASAAAVVKRITTPVERLIGWL